MAKIKSKDMKCECKHTCCMILCKAFWLTLAIFLAHYLSDVLGIEKMASENLWGWIALFVWYMLFMVVGLKILYGLHHSKNTNF